MTTLAPFESLFQATIGEPTPLPPEIDSIYGPLTLPPPAGRPLVVSNFVTTLDGVVSLRVPGHEGGNAISGNNRHDRLLVATLCALADAIVIGSGTLGSSEGHIWTGAAQNPDFADAFVTLRRSLGKTSPPLNVIVTGHGDIDSGERMFQTGEVPAMVITSTQGAARLRRAGMPDVVEIAIAGDDPDIDPRVALNLIAASRPMNLILLEAGPRLTTAFLAARLVDELFLTLSPQLAGRDDGSRRLSLTMGHLFAPNDALWGNLVDIRRAGSHLFLRYSLPRE
ncbi:MAG TPA: dihydrofolate reductase family protein [Thermomicrobiales bacterium]|nr:dihydrofolate reductase family protein [Thermomicrobiales bacterium]